MRSTPPNVAYAEPSTSRASGTPEPTAERRSPFIISPWHDSFFFLLSPWLGFLFYWFVMPVRTAADGNLEVLSRVDVVSLSVLHALTTQTHVFLVFFRSHLNPQVFRRYPLRFTVVPLFMLTVTFTSELGLALFVAGAFFFDIYHSSMQTFGLGRIYDAKSGFPSGEGRYWDIWLNHFLYVGPILGGFNLFYFLNGLAGLKGYFPKLEPAVSLVMAYRDSITHVLLVAGTLFVGAYAVRVALWWRRGLRVSPLKLVLFAGTGVMTLYTWAYLPFLVAQPVVNFYHAVQYFALIWWTERAPLTRNLRLSRIGRGLWPAAVLMAVPSFTYACCWARFDGTGFVRLSVVVSLLHFWYDGFIWSVRRREVLV